MKYVYILVTVILLSMLEVNAYKTFSYDSNGNRVYTTIEQKDFAKYKNLPRRSYVRQPRVNWEINDNMRARKRTTSDVTHR